MKCTTCWVTTVTAECRNTAEIGKRERSWLFLLMQSWAIDHKLEKTSLSYMIDRLTWTNHFTLFLHNKLIKGHEVLYFKGCPNYFIKLVISIHIRRNNVIFLYFNWEGLLWSTQMIFSSNFFIWKYIVEIKSNKGIKKIRKYRVWCPLHLYGQLPNYTWYIFPIQNSYVFNDEYRIWFSSVMWKIITKKNWRMGNLMKRNILITMFRKYTEHFVKFLRCE